MSILGINTKLAPPLEKLGATDIVLSDGVTVISTNTIKLNATVGSTDESYIYLSTLDGSVLQNYTFDLVISGEAPVELTSETVSTDQDILTVKYSPTRTQRDNCLINLHFPALATTQTITTVVPDPTWVPPAVTMAEVLPSPNNDDDFFEVFVPFPFIFNGVDYGNGGNNGVFVGSNSYVSFGDATNSYNVNLANSSDLPLGIVNGLSFASGDYSATSIQQGVFTDGDITTVVLTFQLDSQRYQNGSIDDTFTVNLRSDNTIIIDYSNITTYSTSYTGVVTTSGGIATLNACFSMVSNTSTLIQGLDVNTPLVIQNYTRPPHTITYTTTTQHPYKVQAYVSIASSLDAVLFTVTPTSFDFGNIEPKASETTTITVECSDPTFNINFLVIGFYATDVSDTSAFALDFNGRTVNSSTSVSFPITFKPSTNKTYEVNLQLFYNQAPVGNSVVLTGSNAGLIATVPNVIKSTVPAPLSSSTIYHTFTNYTPSSIRITDATLMDDVLGEFSIINYDILVGLVLKPTESVSIPITYTPKQEYYQLPQVSVHGVSF